MDVKDTHAYNIFFKKEVVEKFIMCDSILCLQCVMFLINACAHAQVHTYMFSLRHNG